MARGTVKGTVVLGERPVPQAHIAAWPLIDNMGGRVTKADQNGEFTWELPAGEYRLMAQRDRMPVQHRLGDKSLGPTVVVAPGNQIQVRVALTGQ